jgi:hypothetical protein
MKQIEWKVVLTDKNQIATLENAVLGFPKDDIETHLLLIGLLENLKQKHLEKLNTLFEKTIKPNAHDPDLDL